MYILYGNTPWVEFTQKFYFLGWNEKHRLSHVDFIPLVYNQTKSFEIDTFFYSYSSDEYLQYCHVFI